jgi:oligoendopeptidase F
MATKRRKKRSSRRRSGIYIKPANRGKLRKATKTKKGAKIPVSKLRSMKKSKNPKTRKRATFALNARGWNKGGKRRKK